MQTANDSRKEILTFLGLTCALSSIFYFSIISRGTIHTAAGPFYALGMMWCPGIAALITCYLFHRNLQGLGWAWGKTRYQLTSYLLPVGYAVVVYLPVWFLGLGEVTADFPNQLASRFGWDTLPQTATIALFLFFAGTIGMVPSSFYALGEEIGWRGFLVPALAKITTFSKTALISGTIWAVWHWPAILFADYRSTTPTWYALLCFTVMVGGMSFAFAWLRLKSGSLWTATVLHASHNLFIQAVFDQLTRDTGVTNWLIGEFGAGLAIASLLVGSVFWKKRLDLPPTSYPHKNTSPAQILGG